MKPSIGPNSVAFKYNYDSQDGIFEVGDREWLGWKLKCPKNSTFKQGFYIMSILYEQRQITVDSLLPSPELLETEALV